MKAILDKIWFYIVKGGVYSKRAGIGAYDYSKQAVISVYNYSKENGVVVYNYSKETGISIYNFSKENGIIVYNFSRRVGLGIYNGIRFPFVWYFERFWDFWYSFWYELNLLDKSIIILFQAYLILIFFCFFWTEEDENDHRRLLNKWFGYDYTVYPYDPGTKGFNAFFHDFFLIPLGIRKERPPFDFLNHPFNPLWMYPQGVFHPDDPRHPDNVRKRKELGIPFSYDPVYPVHVSDPICWSCGKTAKESLETINPEDIENLGSALEMFLELIKTIIFIIIFGI